LRQYAFPVLYALFLWWFGTGIILYLDGLPRRTYPSSLAGATVVLAAALYGLAATRADVSVAGAYVAFTCAVLVWGWLEMTFLMGYVTGPRDTPCPPGSRGLVRARYALETILYHEFALLVAAVVVAVTTLPGTNTVGAGTFLILWVMRQSAKLNVFLGVRNLAEEFLPPHLRYLESYFRRKPMNALFPVLVTLATGTAAVLWWKAATAAGAFEATSFTFLATMMTLAVLEHGFLVLPLPATALWRWGLRSREVLPATRAGSRADAFAADSAADVPTARPNPV
jgi:putative photosynthetic complex assembly protein 2